MRAPTRWRGGSRSGCAATSAGSRIIRRRDRTATRRKRSRHHGSQAPSYIIATPEHDDDDGESTGFDPVIIAESTTALKRLSVSDAVMELDLTGAAVVVFRHAGHGRVNLVYRRGDGHIGWIDPPMIEAQGSRRKTSIDAH